MENNQENVQNEVNNVEQNVNENKPQKSGKGTTVVLMIVVLILVLAIGLCGGYLLSNKNRENSTNNTTEASNKTETSNTVNTNSTDKIQNKVVSVIDENKDSEPRDQMTIAGKDENGNVVWRYTTLESNIPVEKSNSGLNLIGTNNGKVYLCDWGNLYILDEQTGSVLKSNVNNDEKIGCASTNTFDKDNNLYTVSYPMYLCKIDENGKFLCSTGELWDKGLIWPKSLKIENDILIAEYYEGTAKVSLSDLSVKEISYNEEKNTTHSTEDEQTNGISKLNVNGTYKFEVTSGHYHNSNLIISDQTDTSIKFSLNTTDGMDVDHVNIGEVSGTANKIDVPENLAKSDAKRVTYQFVETNAEGKTSKITFTIKAYGNSQDASSVTITEEYPDNINQYAGAHVYFAGDYEKVK